MEMKSQVEPTGNTKSVGQETQAYRWCFTLPMECCTEQELADLLNNAAKEWYFQGETGETGYDHWQGCCSLKEKHRMNEVKNLIGFHKIHLEKAKDWIKAKLYCQKKESRKCGPWSHNRIPIEIIKDLRPWQKELEEYVLGKPNDREIRWYVDPIGGTGKTKMCRYLAIKHGAGLVPNGRSADLAHAIKDNKSGIILFDFARTIEGRVNYTIIEDVKNGNIFNSKYESKMIFINTPHVIVFSNFEPNLSALSSDRWSIHRL